MGTIILFVAYAINCPGQGPIVPFAVPVRVALRQRFGPLFVHPFPYEFLQAMGGERYVSTLFHVYFQSAIDLRATSCHTYASEPTYFSENNQYRRLFKQYEWLNGSLRLCGSRSSSSGCLATWIVSRRAEDVPSLVHTTLYSVQTDRNLF
jgi:hypothetical protein